jgi:hypothetical protein
MKKTFSFISSNKMPDRQAEAIRQEVKKYLARERRKTVPSDADFWNFECKIGPNAEEASAIHVNEISEMISKYMTRKLESFYLEILAKPGNKPVKSID